MKKHILLTLILFFFFAPSVTARDARQIMKEVLDRNDGTTEVARVILSTCPIQKKGKKYVCTAIPRVKAMDMIRKDFGPNEKDKKTVTIVLEPAGEKGIGFLQYDYEEKGRETDQWLYLSAMGKVKRIVSSNENEPKTGSFFGSELSYEDMEEKHLDDYTYKVLGHETVNGRDCTVLETIPTKDRARKSNYSKFLDWVDEERAIILKSLLFNRQGKKLKRIYYGNITVVDGVLVPMATSVYNLETRRRTRMIYEKVAINVPVQDEFLTQRTLTDGAFREINLKRYQAAF